MRLRHQLGVLKTPAAIEYIDDFLTNLPSGRKILVFAHHKDVIEQAGRGACRTGTRSRSSGPRPRWTGPIAIKTLP